MMDRMEAVFFAEADYSYPTNEAFAWSAHGVIS